MTRNDFWMHVCHGTAVASHQKPLLKRTLTAEHLILQPSILLMQLFCLFVCFGIFFCVYRLCLCIHKYEFINLYHIDSSCFYNLPHKPLIFNSALRLTDSWLLSSVWAGQGMFWRHIIQLLKDSRELCLIRKLWSIVFKNFSFHFFLFTLSNLSDQLQVVSVYQVFFQRNTSQIRPAYQVEIQAFAQKHRVQGKSRIFSSSLHSQK